MSFSWGSFAISCLLVVFLVVYLHIVIYVRKDILCICAKFTSAAISLLLLRMLLPIHFPFAKTVNMELLLSGVDLAFRSLGDVGKTLGEALLWLWGAGIWTKLAFLIVSQIRFRCWLRPYVAAGSRLPREMQEILRECGEAGFRVAVYATLAPPSVVGLFRPVLILPEGDYTSTEMRYIFRHEIEHYKNGDLWRRALLDMVLCVQWFNPFAYILRRELTLMHEMANDQRVIGSCGEAERREYAECLLKIARRVKTGRMKKRAASFVEARNDGLETRIQFIIEPMETQEAKRNGKWIDRLLNIALIVLLIGSFLIAPDPHGARP